MPALATLRRRAGGDWSRDRRPERFPAVDLKTLDKAKRPPALKSGLTCWAAFELWIAGRQPAPSTINRWRAVFNSLRERFGDRDVSTISPEEAQEWLDGLMTPGRSAHVVEHIWMRSAKTVMGWAVKRKRLTANPFQGTTVAVPRAKPKLREREFHEEEWRTILRATLQPSPPRMEPYNAAAHQPGPLAAVSAAGSRSG